MARQKTIGAISKKQWNQHIKKVLEDSLVELKDIFGEKKFEKKLQKVSQLLTPGGKYRRKVAPYEKAETKPKAIKSIPVK